MAQYKRKTFTQYEIMLAMAILLNVKAGLPCKECDEITVMNCWNCGSPICERHAVQVEDGHFCPTCPKELPF